mmetsp:Transcript_28330/g.55467  ORF Transcript_28330/g.55467 Transcript_28330/m.55467 type:complete len:324 (+) Transcript_28330:319-1290(+)
MTDHFSHRYSPFFFLVLFFLPPDELSHRMQGGHVSSLLHSTEANSSFGFGFLNPNSPLLPFLSFPRLAFPFPFVFSLFLCHFALSSSSGCPCQGRLPGGLSLCVFWGPLWKGTRRRRDFFSSSLSFCRYVHYPTCSFSFSYPSACRVSCPFPFSCRAFLCFFWSSCACGLSLNCAAYPFHVFPFCLSHCHCHSGCSRCLRKKGLTRQRKKRRKSRKKRQRKSGDGNSDRYPSPAPSLSPFWIFPLFVFLRPLPERGGRHLSLGRGTYLAPTCRHPPTLPPSSEPAPSLQLQPFGTPPSAIRQFDLLELGGVGLLLMSADCHHS